MQRDLKNISRSRCCSDTSLMRLSIHASQGEGRGVWARHLTSVNHWCLPNNLLTLNQQPTDEWSHESKPTCSIVLHIFWSIFLNHLCNICYTITKVIKNKQGYSLKDAPCSYNILCSNLSSLLRFFYLSFQVQLLHFLVAVSYSNEGARLWLLLSATIPFHLLFFFLPSTAHKIHTWRRTKEPENEKCIMRLHIAFKKILETKTVMYPKLSQPICTLHSSLYMQALHLPCRLSKMQTRKEKKQGK